MKELQELVDIVKTENEDKENKSYERTGEEDDTHIEINGEYTYLGGHFTDDYDDAFGIRKRLGIAKNATEALSNVLKVAIRKYFK